MRLPRSTGEIISDAVGLLRRHFGVVFAIAVPFCAVDLLVREVGTSLILGINTALSNPENANLEVLASLLPNFMGGMGFLAASFCVQMLLNGSITAVADDVFAGREASARSAIGRIAERGAPLIATSLLFMFLLMAAVSLVFGIPAAVGVAAAVALDAPVVAIIGMFLGLPLAFAVMVVMSLRWSLYAPAVVCEGRSLWGALKRSSMLTAPRGLPFFETPRFRLSILFMVTLAISSVLQSLFLGPRLVMAVVTGWSFTDGGLPGLAQLPLWFGVPFGLLEVVTNAAVIPLSGVLLALFMFDLRLRYDVNNDGLHEDNVASPPAP